MKKAAYAIAAVMLLSASVMPTASSADIISEDWYQKSVELISENGENPQKELTRADVALLICKALSLQTAEIGDRQIQTESSFEAKSFLTSNGDTIGYWLFTPRNANENMPMIVYLHGSHGQGDDLSTVLQDEFVQMVSGGDFDNTPAYIIIPQLPSKYKSWRNINSELIDMIDNTANTYHIDKSNISLTGYSMGGTGAVNLAADYPGYFSRIAFLSGSTRNVAETASRLSGTPIRAFVGSEDVIVKPESAVALIGAIKQNGGDAEVTVFDGADHIAVPSLVFADKGAGLINWLIGES